MCVCCEEEESTGTKDSFHLLQVQVNCRNLFLDLNPVTPALIKHKVPCCTSLLTIDS